MEEKRYIYRFLKRARKRLSLGILVKVLPAALAAGFGVGAGINLAALLWPVYGAFWISIAALMAAAGVGLIIAVIHFPDRRKTAREVDKRGLKERLTTFVELETMDSEKEESAWREWQARNTYEAVKTYDLKAAIPIRISGRQICLLACTAVVFAVAAVLPSPNKELAAVRHEQKAEAAAKIEKLAKADEELEELKMAEQFSAKELEEIEELQEIIKKTQKELAAAETAEELSKAMERLETKTTQSLFENRQTQAEKKASALRKNVEELWKQSEKTADLTDSLNSEEVLKAMEELLEELAGELSDKELTALAEQLAQLKESFSAGSVTAEQLTGLLEGLENASLSNSTANQLAKIMEETAGVSLLEQTSAFVQAGQSENGNALGNGNSTGNLSGNGTGNGTGNGSGNGNGQSGGIGGGKNQGSQKGIQKENDRAGNSEQVMLSGRELGEDENLTGQSGSGESYKSIGGQGLTWSGEKVNYDAIIGEYTKKAYARMENNEVPKGMEEIVKGYFEGINQ